jgi:hypothetical protein
MDYSFLTSINYVAVIISAVAIFFAGSVWFSALFGKIWVHELSRHNITIQAPSSAKLALCMGLTFLQNNIMAFAMACLVSLTHSTTCASGLMLGLIVALGFAATAIGGVFTWESRSVKLFLIDAGYPMVGIILSAIILSVWR